MTEQWIPIERIQFALQLEPFIVGWAFYFLSILFYWGFLKQISDKRHRNLQYRFKNTFLYLSISSLLTLCEWSLLSIHKPSTPLYITGCYLGLIALVISAISVVKLAQIYVYHYLFFSNMKQGVPRLLANMFTFALSIILTSMIASNIFGIHLATVLATSAVFSLVLGLALQDTLGNLFAGIALQLDHPFQIGDWLEVHSGPEKWIGQVQEITWRATFLLSFSDEVVLIPNRIISQSQLLIFSKHKRSPRFSQVFRIPYTSNISFAKEIIINSINQIDGVLSDPPPRVLLTETNESWLVLKAFYSIQDFGMRYRIGDKVIEKIVSEFSSKNIKLASSRIEVIRE